MSANKFSTSSLRELAAGRICLVPAAELPLASLVDLHNLAHMKGLRIIVLMLVMALGLSGWATNVHALAESSPELGSSVPAGNAEAGEADCAKPVSQVHHDHSQGGDGLNCCHLMAPALELYSASAYPPGWYVKAAHVAVHPDSATGVMPAPTLRPPRT